MTYDPKYKLKHRPPRIERLLRYKDFPPPMVGDPLVCAVDWESRCRYIYEHMMRIKRGEQPVWTPPPLPKRGVWFWDICT